VQRRNVLILEGNAGENRVSLGNGTDLKLEREFSAGTHGKGEGAWALPGEAQPPK
jgi:hypothetical protein